MENKRIKFCDTRDRISALPDPIIQHILSFLPSTRAAIRTSILSKRWRNQWTQAPVLIFKSGDERNGFIENTLIVHDCPKINKLHLHYDFKSDPRFTTKLIFAARKCVQDLILSCRCDNRWYSLPKLLIDNACLVRLEMVNCHFRPGLRVNWPSLKCLKMNCDDGSCSEGIDNVVSNCPLLERFEFHGTLLGDVAVISRSLKVLNFVDVNVPDSITVSCPHLEEFSVVTENWDDNTFPIEIIENVLSESLLIRSMKLVECYGSKLNEIVVASESLKVLHLQYIEATSIEVFCPNLERLDLLCFCHQTVEVVNLPSSISVSLNLYPKNMVECLQQFQHVNKLTIGRALFRNILELGLGDRLSLPSLNCKCLALTVGANFGVAMPGIAYALSSPMLETLVINSEFMYMNDSLVKDYWNSTGCAGFTCLESHLKTVKIIGKCGEDDECKRVFEFIEFLLENARVLEKMIVLLEEPLAGFELEFSKKLLSLPRYSRCARVELRST